MKYAISIFLVFLCSVSILSRNLSKTENKSQNSNKEVFIVDAPIVTTSSTEVTTLVEYPVTASTSISYYYPYFYKTKLISFNDEVDTTILITSCPDNSCGWCDPILPSRCMKCAVGFYLSGEVCVSYCPEGYISDVLRFRCVAVAQVTTEVVYTKAYSFGSCRNTCGKTMSDCSCEATCKVKGNCCTDYDTVNCEGVIQKNNNVKEKDCENNHNCLYCDDNLKHSDDVPKCNQCQDKFYLHEGRCYPSCPESTVPDFLNLICKKKPTCDAENCETCNLDGKCNSCKRGYFLYNGECFQKCPSGYRADRITWTCLEPPVFAWYWVYPSRSSCKNYCGVIVQEFDCSCSADCFLYGNCCQDIEYTCPSILFWRKKAPNDKASAKSLKKIPALPSSSKNKIDEKNSLKKDANIMINSALIKKTNTK
jgi:hypothetical protein